MHAIRVTDSMSYSLRIAAFPVILLTINNPQKGGSYRKKTKEELDGKREWRADPSTVFSYITVNIVSEILMFS